MDYLIAAERARLERALPILRAFFGECAWSLSLDRSADVARSLDRDLHIDIIGDLGARGRVHVQGKWSERDDRRFISQWVWYDFLKLDRLEGMGIHPALSQHLGMSSAEYTIFFGYDNGVLVGNRFITCYLKSLYIREYCYILDKVVNLLNSSRVLDLLASAKNADATSADTAARVVFDGIKRLLKVEHAGHFVLHGRSIMWRRPLAGLDYEVARA